MKIFDALVRFVKGEVDERAYLTPVNKGVLLESIQENITLLNSSAKAIKDTSFNRNGLLQSFVARLETDKNIKNFIDPSALAIPVTFTRELIGRAKGYDDQSFLNSIHFVCNVLIDVNKRLFKDIDKVIAEDNIILNNVKVTDVYCLSLIRQSDIYSSYANNMIGMISSVIGGVYSSFPKYRQNFLITNFRLFVDITNKICASPNNVFMLREIQKIKEEGNNFRLNNVNGAVDGLSVSTFSNEITFGMRSFMLFPNPFRFFSEIMVDRKHDAFIKNKETKEWLEYHVALLRMDREGMDPNSPKYVTTAKAIAFYEDKISKKQAEIDRYMKD